MSKEENRVFESHHDRVIEDKRDVKEKSEENKKKENKEKNVIFKEKCRQLSSRTSAVSLLARQKGPLFQPFLVDKAQCLSSSAK